jgi:hypothetical protein
VLAERNRLRLTWSGVPPRTIFGMAADHCVQPLETPAHLLRAVIASLRRLEGKLHGVTPAVVDLWNKNAPKDENAFSDYIARHLNEDLKQIGVVAGREAEVHRGHETDIYVDAVIRGPLGGRAERISLVVEIKGCWHRELRTAMSSQLKGKYLRDHPIGYGLYLVGWFSCAKWENNDPRKRDTPAWTLDQARDFFANQSVGLSDERVTIDAYVMDAALR